MTSLGHEMSYSRFSLLSNSGHFDVDHPSRWCTTACRTSTTFFWWSVSREFFITIVWPINWNGQPTTPNTAWSQLWFAGISKYRVWANNNILDGPSCWVSETTGHGKHNPGREFHVAYSLRQSICVSVCCSPIPRNLHPALELPPDSNKSSPSVPHPHVKSDCGIERISKYEHLCYRINDIGQWGLRRLSDVCPTGSWKPEVNA